MASWREKEAKKAGMSLKEYKKTSDYKEKKKARDAKEESKKAEKKAKKKTKEYYKEKESQTKAKAKLDTKKLQQDVDIILREAGITKTRAIEDYLRNVGNIEANKSADVEDLNYYVETATGRTQEDLDTALSKESRRYSIELDRINEDLANRGMTFSKRIPEQKAIEENQATIQGIQAEANRSFADIQRYEATKNRDIELKYGQLEEKAGTDKTRTLEDIMREQKDAQAKLNLGKESIAMEKSTSLKDIRYDENQGLASVENRFADLAQSQKEDARWEQLYGN